jgi:M6 family metalloprotease-like protein
MSLVAAPAGASQALRASAAGPCALERTVAHHSEGLDTWNPAYPRPARTLDAVMVFLSFPDARPRVTPEELTADYFPATSEFFAQASYGRFVLRPHPRREWIRMPRPSVSYGAKRDWSAENHSAYLRDAVAAADPVVDFARYDIVYLVADPHAPGVDSDATKVVNLGEPLEADGTQIRRAVTVFEQHPPDRNVLAHETGHVFDLPDLYHRPTDGRGDWDTHVGDWDVMGSQFGLAPDFFGWHKWKLGWLGPRQVACLAGGEGGSTLHSLQALSAPLPPAGGRGADSVRLAVVRTGEDSAIAIEARGAAGNDRAICSEGVLVYRVRNGASSGGGPVQVFDAHPDTDACWGKSVYPPLADAPLGVGEILTVPGGTGETWEATRFEVVDRTASGAWTVKITRS